MPPPTKARHQPPAAREIQPPWAALKACSAGCLWSTQSALEGRAVAALHCRDYLGMLLPRLLGQRRVRDRVAMNCGRLRPILLDELRELPIPACAEDDPMKIIVRDRGGIEVSSRPATNIVVIHLTELTDEVRRCRQQDPARGLLLQDRADVVKLVNLLRRVVADDRAAILPPLNEAGAVKLLQRRTMTWRPTANRSLSSSSTSLSRGLRRPKTISCCMALMIAGSRLSPARAVRGVSSATGSTARISAHQLS